MLLKFVVTRYPNIIEMFLRLLPWLVRLLWPEITVFKVTNCENLITLYKSYMRCSLQERDKRHGIISRNVISINSTPNSGQPKSAK